MTVSFLFWNLHQQPLQNIIANLTFRHQVDILMFSECSIEPGVLLRSLNPPDNAEYFYAPGTPGNCEKIQMFTRFHPQFIQPVSESHRWTIRHLKLSGKTDMLLAVAHLVSKNSYSEQSQSTEATRLSIEIKKQEDGIGHTRTVLVGDLNMNPFEDGVVSAGGFHGVMSRSIAMTEMRVVQKEKYPFFLQPYVEPVW